MKEYIEARAIELANYIIENTSTVRETAKKFAMSKSSVHKDVTDRLSKINPRLAQQTKSVLEFNKAERHIRGGLATKHKYEQLRAKKDVDGR